MASREPAQEPLMDLRDHRLSMRISPRAKRARDNEGLRRLLVHRLTDTDKAVARIGLRTGIFSIFCEPCDVWHRVGDDLPLEWICPGCGRGFQIEFAVMEEVELHDINGSVNGVDLDEAGQSHQG